MFYEMIMIRICSRNEIIFALLRTDHLNPGHVQVSNGYCIWKIQTLKCQAFLAQFIKSILLVSGDSDKSFYTAAFFGGRF